MRKLLAATLCLCLLGAAGCAVLDVLPNTKRSTHFVPTTKHLDLGGSVFFYADLDGDLEKITAFFAQLLDEIKKENPDPELDKIDLPKLVGLLGFNRLQAVGLSSYQSGKLFHNKGFIYHPAPREGFMRLLGDKAHPYETPNWAPADADLVFEQDYNFYGAYQVMEAMLRQVMGAEADEIFGKLNELIPQLHVTLRQIVEKLDTRMVLVVRIHEEEMIHLEEEDVDFPYTEIALGLDGMGFIFDDLVESFGEMPLIQVTAGADFHSIVPAKALPGQLAVYKPVLAKDVKTGRVYFATSLKLLKEFAPGPKALGRSKVFATAAKGFPKSGNGLTFVSDKFVSKLMSWLTRMSEKNEEVKNMLGILEALMPEQGTPMASCNGMLPEGQFFISNSSLSHKTTILSLGYANPMMIGILAAVAIPAFIGYQDKAEAEAEALQVPDQPQPVPAAPHAPAPAIEKKPAAEQK